MRHSTLLTEFTDISQRLEYLVAHSSQLVFITGEDAAVQQGFVEAFLGQQSNSANVAFLNAKRGKSNQYNRQQLADQLNLHTSRNQSFVQAFASRDDKTQPVIVAITCAENISEDVLRELWDLVLQNRFARNGEQVNILMFGDHEWAEEVKSWLPTNNNDKPVLLTTQTLEYNEETEVEGDLDEMIANRRKMFQKRMQARAKAEFAEQSLLSTLWFKLVVAAVFLVSFSSIMIWQYFDVSKAALTEFTQFLFQDSTVSDGETSADAAVSQRSALTTDPNMTTRQSENNDSNQRVAANFSAAMESLDGKQTQQAAQAQDAEPQQTSVNSFSQRSADSPNSEYIADISTEQLKQLRDAGTYAPTEVVNSTVSEVQEPQSSLAAYAQDAALDASILEALNELDALGYQPSTEMVAADVTPPQAIEQREELSSLETGQWQTPSLAEVSESSDPDERLREELAANEAQTVSDYLVKDAAPVTKGAAVADPVLPNTETQVETREEPQLPESTNQENQPGFRYHEPVLLDLPNDSYVLQLSGITTESLLEEFLVDNRLLNSVWVYKTQRYGGDWFVVLLNQSFDSLPVARNAVSLLSNDLQAVEPFAKSVAQIRNEILQ